MDVSSMERRSDASRTLISADSRWWSYYYLPTYLGNRLPVFAGLVNAPFRDPGWRSILLISVIH